MLLICLPPYSVDFQIFIQQRSLKIFDLNIIFRRSTNPLGVMNPPLNFFLNPKANNVIFHNVINIKDSFIEVQI